MGAPGGSGGVAGEGGVWWQPQRRVWSRLRVLRGTGLRARHGFVDVRATVQSPQTRVPRRIHLRHRAGQLSAQPILRRSRGLCVGYGVRQRWRAVLHALLRVGRHLSARVRLRVGPGDLLPAAGDDKVGHLGERQLQCEQDAGLGPGRSVARRSCGCVWAAAQAASLTTNHTTHGQ